MKDQNGSRVYLVFVLMALPLAVLTGRQTAHYGAPVHFALFTGIAAFIAIYQSLDYFHEAWRRARDR